MHIAGSGLMAALIFSSMGPAAGEKTGAPKTQPDQPMITILHTNDIHGHVQPWIGWEDDLQGRTIGGFDRLAAAVQAVRSKVGPENVLLLDAGDAIGDTMVATATQGQAVRRLLAVLGYDAIALGNHEPDYGIEVLEQHARADSLTFLAANVLQKSTGRHLVRPYLVKSVGSVKVGIVGLSYPNTPRTTAPKNVADLSYRHDSPEVIREYLPILRQEGAELVVVLSHLGLSADLKLAEEVQGIHIIVGGHSHNRMKRATRVGDTLVVQAGAHCSDLGRLDLVFSGGRVQRHRRELILLDHATVPSNDHMAKTMKAMLEPLRPKLDEIVGTAAAPIVRAQTLADQDPRKRHAESPADSLFADILREHTGSQIALLPGVGYGVAIPVGPITAEALGNLLPHKSKVVTLNLTGEQVRAILEQAVTNVFSDDPKVKVGGMIQVSGLRFIYDPSKTPSVQSVLVGQAPLASGRRYTVATNSMMANGGHNYRTFLRARGRRERAGQYDVVRQWMSEHSPVRTPPPARIHRVGFSSEDQPE